MIINKINTMLKPHEIFKNLYDKKGSQLLHSQSSHDNLGKYSYIVHSPIFEITYKNNNLFKNKELINQDPLKYIDQILEKYKVINKTEFDFIGGLVGFFSYEIGNLVSEINNYKNQTDMYLGFYNQVIIFDHINNSVYEIKLDEFEFEFYNIDDYLNDNNQEFSYNGSNFITSIDKEKYSSKLDKIHEYIKSGDVYQINYAYQNSVDFIGNPFGVYLNLCESNKAPFSSYNNVGFNIISSSPELFFKVHNNKIYTQPMKGTVKKVVDEKQNKQNLKYLKTSIKEQAELLMIVDLERNDFSKICTPNSVEVKNLFKICEYATVYQQVADIYGQLKSNILFSDVFMAMYPGGSITGTPKLRARQIIEELENTNRGVYTGSIGYISLCGNSEFNIAIRTITHVDNKMNYNVGGGITWDSDSNLEYEETKIKGYALKQVLLNDK